MTTLYPRPRPALRALYACARSAAGGVAGLSPSGVCGWTLNLQIDICDFNLTFWIWPSGSKEV